MAQTMSFHTDTGGPSAGHVTLPRAGLDEYVRRPTVDCLPSAFNDRIDAVRAEAPIVYYSRSFRQYQTDANPTAGTTSHCINGDSPVPSTGITGINSE